MKAPTYPDAVHNAAAIPTNSRMPAAPLLSVRPSIGPLKVSTAEAGPIALTTSVSDSVTVLGSPTSPTIDTIAISAGKMESTA